MELNMLILHIYCVIGGRDPYCTGG